MRVEQKRREDLWRSREFLLFRSLANPCRGCGPVSGGAVTRGMGAVCALSHLVRMVVNKPVQFSLCRTPP